MVTLSLLVRMEAKPDKDIEIEEFLLSALTMVQQEAATAFFPDPNLPNVLAENLGA